MSSTLQKQLQALSRPDLAGIIDKIQRGIEKESLRIDADGRLALTPHPAGLGSALTHSSITTDYSEALLEFITPVSTSIEDSLRTLEDVQSFVYQHLGDELLWAASMPCIVAGDDGIPVARYGSSNTARMKTVYRYGLGHRYGRMMQAIAGIHYNFSMPQTYWESSWRAAGEEGDISDYITGRYLGLIRNFRRYSWLLIYLYGASPAVCASFLRGRDHHGLQPFDERGRSLYLPYGTALRMGDLGYNSSAQKGLNICYNSLDRYIETLRSAILTPHPAYRAIGAHHGSDYQQLNDSLLQIENEFYSPIRPKRVARPGETALNALHRGGIEYVEVRCVDVSPFSPVGLDAEQARFLDTFLLFCLLEESPDCGDAEQAMQVANLEAVVNRGRQPGLVLQTSSGERPLAEWAAALLAAMQPVADLQDAACRCDLYGASLQSQQAKVADPELTPSARILREMRERDLPFFRLAMNYSLQWADYFRSRPLAPETQAAFEEEVRRSIAAQREIEAADTVSFEQYLRNYYAQYEAL
ncbi:MAG: glutamate--cysteine ligase [Halioglobus sp.]